MKYAWINDDLTTFLSVWYIFCCLYTYFNIIGITMFNERKSIHQVEESNEFAPKFDQNGLIVVTTVDV